MLSNVGVCFCLGLHSERCGAVCPDIATTALLSRITRLTVSFFPSAQHRHGSEFGDEKGEQAYLSPKDDRLTHFCRPRKLSCPKSRRPRRRRQAYRGIMHQSQHLLKCLRAVSGPSRRAPYSREGGARHPAYTRRPSKNRLEVERGGDAEQSSSRGPDRYMYIKNELDCMWS